MLTEPVTIPLTDHHRAQFARWDLEIKAIQSQMALAVEVLIATQYDPAALGKIKYTVANEGLVITAPES